jgi:hypothetical protein
MIHVFALLFFPCMEVLHTHPVLLHIEGHIVELRYVLSHNLAV